MVFFTSDTHYGHANIIKYSKRPFSNVDEMNNAIINNHNSIVRPNDTVYHLGDFALGGGTAEPYLNRLNGQIHLIIGNHEKPALRVKHKFASVDYYKEISIEGKRYILCHYAFKVWNKSQHGSRHLFGHSHGSLLDDPNALSLDVGVDCWNYFPVSINQIEEKMKLKTWKPVDHHGKDTN